ncbi:MAG: hydantoinase B/oxoprolinase family protein [Methylococcaceae bacterium]|jgi:5-oxoprolinase (ATP-hydrolysing)
MQSGWQFWIDRGGTFTDIVARAPSGQITTRKLLSEHPEHYQDAALQGIQDILQHADNNTISSIKMGTTVGTNALLERKGAAVALLINKGYKDCLRIAYQNRPDIFALHIQKPEPLYQHVIEIDARHDAAGQELQALNLPHISQQLLRLYGQGLRAIAVVLMHAWRYPAHELAIAELAKNIGFQQISLSHQVSPLPKIVSRGDTTVVDAYLSPVLRHYVHQLQQGLMQQHNALQLLFMQSNGGLVQAQAFQGKDSILSGPAGGMVGAVAVCKQAGLDKIIAFDMGGTSTDVAHYAGELERSYDTEVAGVRIRTPMMAINTVAAGGGSVLHFDALRYRVGPDSAGANPGPACYRRGGPLTVTDANLLLGKLANFPAVFGPDANLPPDIDCVRQLFSTLAEQIYTATGDRRSPEQVAEGFLTIAIENMADAIKKISVQKGYHLAEYALCCYGAAGAQHACQLADRLAMQSVLLHPLAGVLSAYGMGLADFRVVRQHALEQPWTTLDIPQLLQHFAGLRQLAHAELRAQGIRDNTITNQQTLALRYQGTDTAVMVDFADTMEQIQQLFEAKYRQQFGFCYKDRPLLLAILQLECIASSASVTDASTPAEHSGLGQPHSHSQLFSQNLWHDAPVFLRGQLAAEQRIAGPAIVLEATSTIVIEPGWQAQLTAHANLMLTRVKPIAPPALAGHPIDPIWLEIFNKRFMSVAEQMGFVLQNTAHSVNIKERLDFSCALFDADGNLIANAPHIPVHLGSMGDSVKALLTLHAESLQPGDAYLLNSPYAGGTHLPDITVVSPVFSNDGQQRLFFVAARGHHADVGGIAPGSMPANSRHIEEEGVISAGLKILSLGQFQDHAIRQWLNSNQHPARNPEQNLADLQAQIAANRKGAAQLHSLLADYSQPVVMAYMQHVQNHAEACVRKLLQGLADGHFEYTMDQGAKIVLNIRINREQGSACIDFTGTTPQLGDNFNAPEAVCKAAVLYVFRTLLQDDIPLNAGCLKPLHIIIPDACLLNPQAPAAVVAGNVETSQYIVDALYGALGVLAASQGTMNNLTFGNQHYQYYETICGGTGAGDGFNGADGVHSHMTNSRITDPEILEQRFPVVLQEFAIRTGSGGAGRNKGGDGVVRRIQFKAAMSAGILSSHRIQPPFGLHGGQAGATGINRIIRADGSEHRLANCSELQINPGDTLIIETPGGGGFGQG